LTDESAGFAVRFATLGPVGAIPYAPGTLGAAAGVCVVALVHGLHLNPSGLRAALAALVAGIYGLGVWSAGRAEKKMGTVDPGPVVIDEVVGQMIAFLFQSNLGWKSLLSGFLLFRFFDILKPFPAGRFEHLPGGWGIMTDDVVAGIYSALALFLLGFAVR
jgi:phosphatidylglycerophosphatase A